MIPGAVRVLQRRAGWSDTQLLEEIFKFHRDHTSTARLVAYLTAHSELDEQAVHAAQPPTEKALMAKALKARGDGVTSIARELKVSRQQVYNYLGDKR